METLLGSKKRNTRKQFLGLQVILLFFVLIFTLKKLKWKSGIVEVFFRIPRRGILNLPLLCSLYPGRGMKSLFPFSVLSKINGVWSISSRILIACSDPSCFFPNFYIYIYRTTRVYQTFIYRTTREYQTFIYRTSRVYQTFIYRTSRVIPDYYI